MRRRSSILLICLVSMAYAQVESIKINKDSFFKPTVNSLGYLMLNVDSVVWNDGLLPIGMVSLGGYEKVNALEYRKKVNGLYEYVGFDDRFWVLTIIWKDESGKNSITKDLKKALKKFMYNGNGYYRIDYQGTSLIIGIEGTKDKVVNEMITVEIERK